jgi:hypothetical protein
MERRLEEDHRGAGHRAGGVDFQYVLAAIDIIEIPGQARNDEA